jgi:hypothetical protein
LARIGTRNDFRAVGREFDHIEVHVNSRALRVPVALNRAIHADKIAALDCALFLNLLVRPVAARVETARRIGRREPNHVMARESFLFGVRLPVVVDPVAVHILERELGVNACARRALGKQIREIRGGLRDEHAPKRGKLPLRVGLGKRDRDKILRVRLPDIGAGLDDAGVALRVFGLRLVERALHESPDRRRKTGLCHSRFSFLLES